ncbi:MAG: amidohydrolase family protein [Oscillospiraceae bacterium]|nr:amidohydrolase family protein [Oscillospiraceae bacterium]
MFNGYTVVDAHAHIFPDKIADKATEGISNFYNLPMSHKGSMEELLASGDKAGLDGYLVCSTATHPAQSEAINTFISEVCNKYPQCIGFAALHPYSETLEDEFERILKMPFKGIKLHPDFQEFNIDDRKVYPMYEMIESAGLPVLMHMGDATKRFSTPDRLAKMLNDFPKIRIIAAHLGGYRRWEEAADILKPSDRLRLDTSSCLGFMPPEDAVRYIHRHGAENCFFGVDFPMWDHKEELERFFRLNLSDTENRKILSENLIEWIRNRK